MYKAKAKESIPMEFHLGPTDTLGRYDYTIIYGEGESRQVRNYTLVEKDASKGQYVVDENNGIALNFQVIANSMYALFEVNGSLLTTQLTFDEHTLIFEITMASKSDAETTTSADESKIDVHSYPLKTVQRAVLQKQ